VGVITALAVVTQVEKNPISEKLPRRRPRRCPKENFENTIAEQVVWQKQYVVVVDAPESWKLSLAAPLIAVAT
jgi:hypothetical protein